MLKQLVIFVILSCVSGVRATDRIEVHPQETFTSGRISEAIDCQFGVTVSGSLDRKIEQLQRELRLMRFSRDAFPLLSETISEAGTNRLASECVAELSAQIGKPIPIDFGTNDFRTGEFVFDKTPLIDALKYLAAFNNSILDVSDEKLVCNPLSQALMLDEPQSRLLQLMVTKDYQKAETALNDETLDVDKIRDEAGQTLLHLAAVDNQTSIVQRLIALGCPIDAQDNFGYTALHDAVRGGNVECVGLLLKEGANAGIPDNNSNTPLYAAIYYGNRAIADALISNGVPVDVFSASALGMAEKVKAMLDDGVRYENIQSNYLAQQIPRGRPIMLGLGDPYHREPGSYLGVYGVSPLHWAARGGSTQVVSLLISNGEPVSLRDSNGDTPLFWAVAAGKVDAAALLIREGADVNATNYFGQTPLLVATRDTDVPDLAWLLIKAGANANAKDSSGENGLHKLAWYGCPENNVQTAKILLDAGADIDAKNNEGKTPLDILLDNDFQNAELVRLYRAHAKAAARGN